MGYSTVTLADHLNDQLGPIAALMAIADASDSMRIASLVFCNDFRNPAIIAKEAATLDLLSEGRYEFGLGAGWMTEEYEQTGIVLDEPATRVERLAESLDVITALWADGPVHHQGRHYTIGGLEGWPKPTTPGGPPIIIGGGGKRVLTLAARRAEIVGLNPNLASGRVDATAGPSATPEATDHKLEWIREAAGTRFGGLEIHTRLHLVLPTTDRPGLIDAMAPAFGMTPEQAAGTPHALVGTDNEMVDQLRSWRDRWSISYIGVPLDATDALAGVVTRLAGT